MNRGIYILHPNIFFQVIPERIRHIEYNPDTPEAFYVPTGKELRPKPINDELGTVIFRYCPTNVTNYVSHNDTAVSEFFLFAEKIFFIFAKSFFHIDSFQFHRVFHSSAGINH